MQGERKRKMGDQGWLQHGVRDPQRLGQEYQSCSWLLGHETCWVGA